MMSIHPFSEQVSMISSAYVQPIPHISKRNEMGGEMVMEQQHQWNERQLRAIEGLRQIENVHSVYYYQVGLIDYFAIVVPDGVRVTTAVVKLEIEIMDEFEDYLFDFYLVSIRSVGRYSDSIRCF